MPNPAQNSTTIDYLYTGVAKNRSIEVYDLLGKLMDTIYLPDNQGTWQLSLDKYDAGMYIVMMKADGAQLLQSKLIVTH